MQNFSIDAPWVAALLTLPALPEQLAYLSAEQLLDEAGLTLLLDYGDGLVQRNPDQARQLALLCHAAAAQLGALTLLPRSLYLQAQSHAINGELTLALTLVREARAGFLQAGLPVAAMRTYIGEMRVLGEQGLLQEALTTGEMLQAWLTENRTESEAAQETQAQLLALLHTQQGICYNQLGRFQAALTVFGLAEAIYARFAMPVQTAAAQNSRGLTLLYLGRVHEALVVFADALAMQLAADLPLLQAHTQSNLGETYLLLGNYQAALAAYDQASNLLANQAALTDAEINRRQMADAYLALNLFDEALGIYREVIHHFDQAGMAHERAWALWGAGVALASQGQIDAASAALAEAAALFARVENQPLLASVRLEQAALLAQQGEQGAALVLATAALDGVSGAAWPVQQFFAHLRLSDLTLSAGDLNAAATHLQAAQQRADLLALPHLSYRLRQRWAQLLLGQGETAKAVAILESAVEEIESLRVTLPVETMRLSFLRDKLAVYELLIQLYLARGDEASINASFNMAERARSRTLIERMVGMTTPSPAPAGQPADLGQRLQALQADLNAVYSRLLNQDAEGPAPSNTERSRASSELYTRAALLEQEISRLQLTFAPAALPPDLFAPLPLGEIQARLDDDVVVIAYYLLDEEVVAFLVTRTALQVMRGLTTRNRVAHLLQRLHDQWQRFRVGHAFATQHQPMLLQSTQRILGELYTELFAPFAPSLAAERPAAVNPQNLIIVPHGLLHQVPFQALFDGQVNLIEHYNISYAPSVTALIIGQPLAQKAFSAALVMGVSAPDLPAIENEVQQVAAQLPGSLVYLNKAATIAILRQQAPTAALLHFACHAIFRTDNPMFSALQLADGWLTALEVAQLQLPCDLVVLSACESGLGYTSSGDEILGLTRAFLSAGVASLVVSQWMVQDEAAAALMTAFYQNLAQGQDVVVALRLAQLTIKQSFPHPYYWAPFMVVGRRTSQLL